MSATGKCLCGAVRYTAEGLSTDLHACHCTMCRRWSGGPAFAARVTRLTVDDDSQLARFDSSDWAERGFCARCGTNLFYHLKEQDQYFLWAGTLDDQAGLRLAGEIYIDEKPAAYSLAGDHPRLTGEQFMASLAGGES